ncbi:hypothetical protein [Paenibacillus sp. 481]|uniref:hypothetical protein n=1 Tax=Paenibacillus sp. 481 TaxID=2835869 RepID=UPI001E2DA6A1|nr:hypothetical protein [Paenibacillus sp. 481]UHA74194.1 hypothetical protein KIK04_03375 [Paenibacillus sp. 481]
MKVQMRSGNMSWFALVLMLGGALFFLSSSPVQAGFWSNLWGITEIPDDVNQLKKSYEDTRKALEETQRQSEEVQKRLASENEKLREQNEQLMQRLSLIEQQNEQKHTFTRRVAITVMVAIGLGLLYFALTRLFRVLVWRRNAD